ncbi:MAG: hypothetical protein HQ551_09645 [Desulfobacteraceae bacterium]|nr:hypothetical protein [Desulfobacteraceae bacterium]
MIREETVFILGAGASAAYKYPTGKELRRIICKEFPRNYKKLLGNAFEESSAMLRERMANEPRELAEAFFNSSTPSIDLFLARNPKLSEIGKRAIALSILQAEHESLFHEDIDSKEDWYSYLYQKMSSELTTPDSFRQFSENKVTFITFNYDRSLEHFLYTSFVNSFQNITPNEVNSSKFLPFKFFHVYGTIADLPWQSKNGIEYGLDPDYYIIEKMKENIKTIYERSSDDLTEMHEAISKAERIFFLGFGYANENLEILDIPKLLTAGQKIHGTALRLTEKEITKVKVKLTKAKSKLLPILNVNCLQLLREYL